MGNAVGSDVVTPKSSARSKDKDQNYDKRENHNGHGRRRRMSITTSLIESIYTKEARRNSYDQQSCDTRESIFAWSDDATALQEGMTITPKNQITELAPYLPLYIIDSISHCEPAFQTRSMQGALLFVDISGFTPLTERFSKEGSAACERFLEVANSYFRQILDIVALHHGDVECFAGDALLIIFDAHKLNVKGLGKGQNQSFAEQTEEENCRFVAPLTTSVLFALKCAEQLITCLSPFEVPGITDLSLSLHGAVGVGEMVSVITGGVLFGSAQCWRSFICGPVMEQIAKAHDLSGKHEIIVTKEVLEEVQGLSMFVTSVGRDCAKLDIPTADDMKELKGMEEVVKSESEQGSDTKLAPRSSSSSLDANHTDKEFLGSYNWLWENRPNPCSPDISMESIDMTSTFGPGLPGNITLSVSIPRSRSHSSFSTPKLAQIGKSSKMRRRLSSLATPVVAIKKGAKNLGKRLSLTPPKNDIFKAKLPVQQRRRLSPGGGAFRRNSFGEDFSDADWGEQLKDPFQDVAQNHLKRKSTEEGTRWKLSSVASFIGNEAILNIQDLEERVERMWPEDIKKYLSRMHLFVPSTVAGKVAAGHSSWLGELRLAHVAFVNFQISGLAGKKIPKESLLINLNTAIRRSFEIIHKYGGFIRQLTMDDKGLVLIYTYGTPGASYDNNIIRALTAAVEMRDGVLQNERIDLRIGISTGDVCCGLVGSPALRCEYSIFGDTVNLAARLSAAACKGHFPVLCCPRTFEGLSRRKKHQHSLQLDEAFSFRPKGKSEDILLYSVQARQNDAENQADFDLDATTIFGREEELQKLKEVFLKKENPQSSVCCVVEGESGIGKSTLLHTFKKQSKEDVILIRSSAVDRSTPYYAMGQIFKVILDKMVDMEEPRQLRVRTITPSATVRRLLTDKSINFTQLLAPSPSSEKGKSFRTRSLWTPSPTRIEEEEEQKKELESFLGRDESGRSTVPKESLHNEVSSSKFLDLEVNTVGSKSNDSQLMQLTDRLRSVSKVLQPSEQKKIPLLKVFGVQVNQLPWDVESSRWDPKKISDDLKDVTVAVINAIIDTRGNQPNIFIFLEDINYLDVGSFEILVHIMANCRRGISLLCSSLPSKNFVKILTLNAYETLLDLECCSKIEVESLSEDLAKKLCCKCLGTHSISDRLFQRINKKCAGNPMFIQEACASFVQNNQITVHYLKNGSSEATSFDVNEQRRQSESEIKRMPRHKSQSMSFLFSRSKERTRARTRTRRSIGSVTSEPDLTRESFIHRNSSLRSRHSVTDDLLPAAMQAVAVARIDSLDAHLALVLKVAAVIGEKFRFDELLSIYPVSVQSSELTKYLEDLCTRDIISTLRADTYMFKHEYLYQTAYTMLLHTHRRKLHRKIAIAMDLQGRQELPKILGHWREVVSTKPNRAELNELGGTSEWTECIYQAIEVVLRASKYYVSWGIIDESINVLRWGLSLLEMHVPPGSFRRDEAEFDLCLEAFEVLELVRDSNEEKNRYKSRTEELIQLPHLTNAKSKYLHRKRTAADLKPLRDPGRMKYLRNTLNQDMVMSNCISAELMMLFSSINLVTETQRGPILNEVHSLKKKISRCSYRGQKNLSMPLTSFQGFKGILAAVEGDLYRYNEIMEVFLMRVSNMLADNLHSQLVNPLSQILLFSIGMQDYAFAITLAQHFHFDQITERVDGPNKGTRRRVQFLLEAMDIYDQILSINKKRKTQTGNQQGSQLQQVRKEILTVHQKLNKLFFSACKRCTKAHFSAVFKLATLLKNSVLMNKIVSKWKRNTTREQTIFDPLLTAAEGLCLIYSNPPNVKGQLDITHLSKEYTNGIKLLFRAHTESQEQGSILFEVQISVILAKFLLSLGEDHRASIVMSSCMQKVSNLPENSKGNTKTIQMQSYYDGLKWCKYTEKRSAEKHLGRPLSPPVLAPTKFHFSSKGIVRERNTSQEGSIASDWFHKGLQSVRSSFMSYSTEPTVFNNINYAKSSTAKVTFDEIFGNV